MKIAALDLGTNSFLCLIVEIKDGQIQKIFSDEVEIVRLGQDVNKTKMFHVEALKRARSCLSKFRKSIDFHQPDRIVAMATSAARDVGNADELFQIGRQLQIPIEIIAGEKEAEITFRGATSGFPKDGKIRAVIDVGGGSTEIIVGKDGKVLAGGSVNVGGIRLTEKFFPRQPPSQEQIESFQLYLREKLSPLIVEIKTFHPEEVIAVAGTPTELAAAKLGKFDSRKIEGMKISLQELGEWRQKFEKTSAEERIQKFHISQGRADIILAGVLIQQMILHMLSVPVMTVSTRGVRFGVALDLADREEYKQP